MAFLDLASWFEVLTLYSSAFKSSDSGNFTQIINSFDILIFVAHDHFPNKASSRFLWKLNLPFIAPVKDDFFYSQPHTKQDILYFLALPVLFFKLAKWSVTTCKNEAYLY